MAIALPPRSLDVADPDGPRSSAHRTDRMKCRTARTKGLPSIQVVVRIRSADVIQSTAGLPFELLESKLLPPRSSQGVARTALLERLNRACATPIVMLCAGPG